MAIIRTPATGEEVSIRRIGSTWFVEDLDGRMLGSLRSEPHGSRKVWGWSLTGAGDYYGRYADQAHAVQGLLARRTPPAGPTT